MKKLKFSKSKLLLGGGLLLTAFVVPTIAIVATSCSNTSTNSNQGLQNPYNPSSELKNIFLQKQYDDVNALLTTFDGSNKILNSATKETTSKNYITKSFDVFENSINLLLGFECSEFWLPNSSNFIQVTAKINLLLNVDTTDPEKLFSVTSDFIIGSEKIPTITNYISKTIFDTIVQQYSLQNWDDTLKQRGLLWEEN